MSKKTNQIRLLIVIFLIIVAASLRLIINIPNVTPIAAIALFAAVTIERKLWAFVLPIAVLFLSDIIIGFYDITVMLPVYISFIMIVGIGFLIRKQQNIGRIIIASITSSILFFVVTNFAVWMAWYPHTAEGLIGCYTLAIPFFRNELIGTLSFTGVLFGSYYLVKLLLLKPVKV